MLHTHGGIAYLRQRTLPREKGAERHGVVKLGRYSESTPTDSVVVQNMRPKRGMRGYFTILFLILLRNEELLHQAGALSYVSPSGDEYKCYTF